MLAVIVILANIALIATPTILGVIGKYVVTKDEKVEKGEEPATKLEGEVTYQTYQNVQQFIIIR